MISATATRPAALWCDRDERYYTHDELVSVFARYLAVMITNGWDIEVHKLDDITEENIGHVVYHAEMFNA